MARILISGAGGFIGLHAIQELSSRHQVYGLLRPASEVPLLTGAERIECDLTVPLDYDLLPAQVDAVIHLAQSNHYRLFPEKALDIFEVNVRSTQNLLEYARRAGAACFIYASSGGVYGHGNEPLLETAPIDPLQANLGFYLTSKYMSELLVANYRSFFRIVILRLFFVYGPGQKPAMLIPSLLERVRKSMPITIEGNPGMRISPTNVADVARVFEPAFSRSVSDVINVAGDEGVTITDIVHLMEDVTGKQAIVRHTENEPGRNLVGDNTKMKEVLGVHPQTSLRMGINRLLSCL